MKKLSFIDQILKEGYEGVITQHKRVQIFDFFAKEFDINLAENMIFENPTKYKKADGSFNVIELKDLEKWFSCITPSDKEKMKQPGGIKLKLGVSVSYEYAMNLSDNALQEPGIWVIEKGFSMLIDGWHRAYARWAKGLKDMEIWVISDPEDVEKIKLK